MGKVFCFVERKNITQKKKKKKNEMPENFYIELRKKNYKSSKIFT